LIKWRFFGVGSERWRFFRIINYRQRKVCLSFGIFRFEMGQSMKDFLMKYSKLFIHLKSHLVTWKIESQRMLILIEIESVCRKILWDFQDKFFRNFFFDHRNFLANFLFFLILFILSLSTPTEFFESFKNFTIKSKQI
jgi:hypothetical protein